MISKNGKAYYDKNVDLPLALANNNALEYALNQGYELQRKGSYFNLKEHDSLVFSPDGKWHWNSQGIKGGDAISFIQNYEGREYKDAILILAGSTGYAPSPMIKQQIDNFPKEKLPLAIPERAKNNDIIFAYLIKTRAISPKLVSKLVSERKIYQSEKYNNLVMMGFDKENNPKYIAMRSTNTALLKPFKADATGSDKSYPFEIRGNNDTVCVFESPIEVMSYYSLCECTDSDKIHCNMISLGGTADVALDRYLSENSHIKNIVICLNNDENHKINAGLNGTKNIQDKYSKTHNVSVHKPHLNDWNDVLKNFKAKQLDRKMPAISKPPAARTVSAER